MSKFLTDTILKVLRGQFREGRQLFELQQEVAYASDILSATVRVPAGYVTDLASTPRVPLLYDIAGGVADEAAIIHDWLYTTHAVDGRPVPRAQADAVLREAIAASEDTEAPGWLMWAAVRLGGRGAWGDVGPMQAPGVVTTIDAQAKAGA